MKKETVDFATWKKQKDKNKKGIFHKIKMFFMKVIVLLIVIFVLIKFSEPIKQQFTNTLEENNINVPFVPKMDKNDTVVIKKPVVDSHIVIESNVTKKQINSIIAKAVTYLGTDYVWGGKDSNGIDCSGLIYQSYKDVYGIKMTHAQEYALMTKLVDKDSIQVGDLIFINKDKRDRSIDHVVIYLGNDVIIHSKGGHGVIIQKYTDDYKNSTMKIGRF